MRHGWEQSRARSECLPNRAGSSAKTRPRHRFSLFLHQLRADNHGPPPVSKTLPNGVAGRIGTREFPPAPDSYARQSIIRSASPRSASNPRWAASATRTTTPWRRRPSACSRPRSSMIAAPGATLMLSSTRRRSGLVDWYNHRRLLHSISDIPPVEKELGVLSPTKRVSCCSLTQTKTSPEKTGRFIEWRQPSFLRCVRQHRGEAIHQGITQHIQGIREQTRGKFHPEHDSVYAQHYFERRALTTGKRLNLTSFVVAAITHCVT